RRRPGRGRVAPTGAGAGRRETGSGGRRWVASAAGGLLVGRLVGTVAVRRWVLVRHESSDKYHCDQYSPYRHQAPTAAPSSYQLGVGAGVGGSGETRVDW